MTKDQKENVRRGLIGKNKIPWNKGKIGIYSIETRSKMATGRMGKIPWNKGIPMTKEQKIKLSVLNSGKNHPRYGKLVSEEIRKKIGLKHRGKTISDEQRETLRQVNLGKKHSEETKKKMSKSHKGLNIWSAGNKSHFWKGGISFDPYSVDWTRTLKISIRERDKYQCRLCGIKQGEIAHHVHHIDYNKNNCNLDNLITLCNKCHVKTNAHREYWKKYFKNNEKSE